MKNLFTLLIPFLACTILFGQQMHVSGTNFHSFNYGKKNIPALLEARSSTAARLHPEYGVLPYNAQCKECVELIDKRTIDSRFYIDPRNGGHTYSQKSYFPLHYKQSEGDVWHTIDYRLRPDSANPGVYTAKSQPVPARCDMNKKSTSLVLDGFEFEFNHNLSLYFFAEGSAYSKTETADYSNYTIGEEGLSVKNIWSGIDMEQVFSTGRIETNYIINAPLKLPIAKGWMVIEDHFSLPAGYSFEESKTGFKTAEGYFQGEYELKNAKGEVLAYYKKPVYHDSKAWAMQGSYQLIKSEGNTYTLQIMLPIDWLTRAENAYPLIIDPLVEGVTKIGNFQSTGGLTANLAFTSMQLGSCNYQMSVTVPGKSKLTNCYVDIEYELTYDNTCDNSQLVYPYCTMSQISQRMINDSCNTSTGLLGCTQATGPNAGICTTDSVLVSGGHAILINAQDSNFLSCIPTQCPDYNIPFTLQNQDSICGDVCGYQCARGNTWQVTVEAEQIQATMQFDGTLISGVVEVCAGQPVTFSGNALDGVPPYHYLWSTDGGVSYDTIYDDSTFTTYPTTGEYVSCVAIDTCGIVAQAGQIQVVILPTPVITVLGDTLTCSLDSSYQWYLNDTAIPGATQQIYIATVPGSYSVRVLDDSCPSRQVIFDTATSITNLNRAIESIKIFPNPSDGDFVLSFNSPVTIAYAEWKILNESGQVICLNKVVINPGINNYAIKVPAGLSSGVYWLEVYAGSKLFTQKIVVEK